MKQSAEDTALQNARAAYEYVVKAHDDVLGQQDLSAQRASKLGIMIALLFGALSFGLGHFVKIVQNPPANSVFVWISMAALVVAAVALTVAFLASIICSRIAVTSIPHTEKLAARADDPRMGATNCSRYLAALIHNVRRAIKDNLSRHDSRKKWSYCLDWAAPIGLISTAVFVGGAVAQALQVPAPPDNAKQCCRCVETTQLEEPMMGKDENGDKPAEQDNEGQNAGDLADEIKGEPDHVRGDDHSDIEARSE